jgi:hypothetical protein
VKGGRRAYYKFGGAAFVASGLLFLCRAVLDFMAGAPPSTGTEILAWIASHSLSQDFQSEILFFAAGFLVPAVAVLYHSLAYVDRTKAVIGSGLMAVAIPVLMMLLIVHGRLVYPVFGIRVNAPEVAALLVALFYGGLHAVYLLMGIATFVLSLAMKGGGYSKPVVYLGFVVAAADIAGSYPDAIGPTLTLGCQVLFAAWFVAVGWELYTLPTVPPWFRSAGSA